MMIPEPLKENPILTSRLLPAKASRVFSVLPLLHFLARQSLIFATPETLHLRLSLPS